MLFNSMSFISLFLPIVCLFYFLLKKESRNFFLLAASIIFYAWGEPIYLFVMLLIIIITYYAAILMEEHPTKKKLILIFSVIADLSFLVYFKYFKFVIDNIDLIFHGHINFADLIIPIGLSFYTFKALSYLIDVYRAEAPVQKDIYKLALYISLFPSLMAGPITKYSDISAQIDSRDEAFEKILLGVQRFIIGLSKKMLIANTMGVIADKIFIQSPDTFSPLISWIGAFAYTFQIYFDFSGYSDMAIGLCLIFGFVIPENFNYPYISKSITEFWRRWHISLSSWFKQYVYIPLGGNKISKKKTYTNLAIVFLLTGIWHGASWTFIFWGLWNGFFIILEKMTGWDKETDNKWINAFKHICTIFIFVFGWVIFRAETMSYAYGYLKNMFGLVNVHNVSFAFPYYIDAVEVITFIFAILCATPLFSKILFVKQENKILRLIVNIWLIFMFILSVSAIAASTYNPFIYFKF